MIRPLKQSFSVDRGTPWRPAALFAESLSSLTLFMAAFIVHLHFLAPQHRYGWIGWTMGYDFDHQNPFLYLFNMVNNCKLWRQNEGLSCIHAKMIAFSIMPLPEMVSLSVEAEIQLTHITAIINKCFCLPFYNMTIVPYSLFTHYWQLVLCPNCASVPPLISSRYLLVVFLLLSWSAWTRSTHGGPPMLLYTQNTIHNTKWKKVLILIRRHNYPWHI